MNKINPGLQLRRVLEELYPYDKDKGGVFVEIDYAIMADGEFSRLLYDSSINYLIRRLITTSEYIKRRFDIDDYPSGTYVEKIKEHLKDFTQIPYTHREKVQGILLECLRLRKGNPSQATKDRLFRQSCSRDLRCYICGGEINYKQRKKYNSFEVEHIWPKSLGGRNEGENLTGACCKCNSSKRDYLDASDFHYEEISLVSTEGESSFSTEFTWDYRVAVLAQHEYKCVLCKKDAQTVGDLHFARRETSDSWHYLNIDVYCSKHLPKEK